jgi:hypothetical protein
MTEWTEINKYEVYAYINKITTPKTAKKMLRHCLQRIEVLERANASFANTMGEFADRLPEILQEEIDRSSNVRELRVAPPTALEESSDD